MNSPEMMRGDSPFSVASSPYDAPAIFDIDMAPPLPPTPLVPPSRTDWDNWRDIIIQYYNTMTTKDLVAYMDLQHGFKATARMYKQRFSEWGFFKYQKALQKRLDQVQKITSAPSIPPSSPTPSTGVHDTQMSRSSSHTSNDTLFSNPFGDDLGTFNEWPCLQQLCEEPGVCAHRYCIQTHLSGLHCQQHVGPTSHPGSISSPYNQMPVPRRGSVERVVDCVNQFSDSWMFAEMSSSYPPQQLSSSDVQAATIILDYPVGHCSHKASPKQCERCTWAEFDFGLAMLEEGHTDAAVASFELGCRLADLLLMAPSKLFIRNLVMAFGSSRWKQHEGFRSGILKFFAGMAHVKLGPCHPITIILDNVAHGDTLVASSELALRAMIRSFEKTTRPAHPDVLLVKRSLSVILRRQQQFVQGEALLLDAIQASESENGYSHKETRRCLRRLGHLYMQQHRWDEAESTFMRIINTAPGKPYTAGAAEPTSFHPSTSAPQSQSTDMARKAAAWIPDEISVYTYQHLARMAADMGDIQKCRWWFGQELDAAIKRWGPSGEYTTECLSLAYNEGDSSLRQVVEQYPDVLDRAELARSTGRIIVSKARWCAVRNLI